MRSWLFTGAGLAPKLRVSASLVLFALLPLQVTAQDEKSIEQLKKATAYIEIAGGELSGTAFCISKQGYFLTCAHVLEGLDIGGAISLSLQPGLPEEKTVKAEVVRLVDDLDLALLKGPPGAVPPLTIGKSSSLRETDPVFAAGFPLGSFLATGKGAPAVTITSGKVTALRRVGEVIDSVQIDAELNPGNSGGPVINKKGEVVGVAVATIFGTGINFAISTRNIQLVLDSPHITASPIEPIPFASRHEELTVKLKLEFLKEPATKPEVKAWFEGATSGVREIAVANPSGLGYAVTGIPVVSDALGSARILRAELVRQIGNHRHTQTLHVLDGELKVDGKPIALSKINLIIPSRGIVRGHNGKELQGTIEGLEHLESFSGGRVTKYAVAGYDVVSLRPASVKQERITCRFQVKGETYTTNFRFPVPVEEGTAEITSFGDPSLPVFDPAAGGDLQFADDRKEVALRGPIYDVSWGGGGRFLVAHLREMRLLEVVDCVKGESLGTIPVEADTVAFGAGARELLVADKGNVTRFDLETLEPIAKPVSWVPGRILRLSVGSGATQFAGVFYDAMDGGNLLRFELRRIQTGELIAIEPMSSSLKKDLHFRASLDGSVHGVFQSQFASGGNRLIYPAGRVMQQDKLNWLGWICPGVDGKLYYTSSGLAGLSGYPQTEMASWKETALIPTTARGIAVRLPVPPGNSRSSSRSITGPAWLDIVDVRARSELLVNAVELEELDTSKAVVEHQFTQQDPFTWEKRCSYSPHLGLLATLPISQRSVILRKLNLWDELRKAGRQFIYVTGVLPDHLKAGGKLDAVIRAESSSAKPLKFELMASPEGMTIDGRGALSWTIDSALAGSVHRLLVRVTSEEGVERLWQHNLSVH